MEEIAVRSVPEVLMEVDDNVPLIVGDPQEILDQQLWPHPIPLLNIILILINESLIYDLINIKLRIILSQGRNGRAACDVLPKEAMTGRANVAIAGILKRAFTAKFACVNKP